MDTKYHWWSWGTQYFDFLYLQVSSTIETIAEVSQDHQCSLKHATNIRDKTNLKFPTDGNTLEKTFKMRP